MHFVNFQNPQTFHFYHWLSHLDEGDPAGVIAKATELADAEIKEAVDAGQEPFDAEQRMSVVEDKLADVLEEFLSTVLYEFTQDPTEKDPQLKKFTGESLEDATGIEPFSYPPGWQGFPAKSGVKELFLPILADALRDISMPAVARAILMRAGLRDC